MRDAWVPWERAQDAWVSWERERACEEVPTEPKPTLAKEERQTNEKSSLCAARFQIGRLGKGGVDSLVDPFLSRQFGRGSVKPLD